jgi:hypothetical protein
MTVKCCICGLLAPYRVPIQYKNILSVQNASFQNIVLSKLTTVLQLFLRPDTFIKFKAIFFLNFFGTVYRNF